MDARGGDGAAGQNFWGALDDPVLLDRALLPEEGRGLYQRRDEGS